jgi:hypothetical protein
MNPPRVAKIQWCGDYIRVYDEFGRDIFVAQINGKAFASKVLKRANKLGYSVPQIYAAAKGLGLRIWL